MSGFSEENSTTGLEPVSLEYQEALEQLRLVNEVFVRSRRYRNLPGASGIAAGLLALGGGGLFWFRHQDVSAAPASFVLTWAVVWALAVGAHFFFSLRNANRRMEPLLSEVALLLGQTILPAVLAAFFLAAALYRLGQVELLAGMWTLLYGMGILSCRPYVDAWIGWFGWCFLLLGALHLLFFSQYPNEFMTLTFGTLHLGYGLRTNLADARENGGKWQ